MCQSGHFPCGGLTQVDVEAGRPVRASGRLDRHRPHRVGRSRGPGVPLARECIRSALKIGDRCHVFARGHVHDADVVEEHVTGRLAEAEMECARYRCASLSAMNSNSMKRPAGSTLMGAAPGPPKNIRGRTARPFTTRRGAPEPASTRTVSPPVFPAEAGTDCTAIGAASAMLAVQRMRPSP